MPGGSGFFPPIAYSPLWAVLAVGLILLVVAWYVFMFLFSRRRSGEAVEHTPPAIPSLGAPLRAKYIGFIDDVARRNRAGEIGYREAHHELSLVVRLFAAEAGGLRAPYLTLEELRLSGYPPLAETVERLYPGAFSGIVHGTVEHAAENARKLVRQWR